MTTFRLRCFDFKLTPGDIFYFAASCLAASESRVTLIANYFTLLITKRCAKMAHGYNTVVHNNGMP